VTPKLTLVAPTARLRERFLAAVAESRALHGRWVRPPATAAEYARYLRYIRGDRNAGHVICTADGELAGVINLTEMVLGSFRSGYLGYYAFAAQAGQGYLRHGLALVADRAFRQYGLHRVEANIQPENVRSKGVVASLGFSCEGYSPRYLKIAGRWRDHERWALTVEAWRAFKRARRLRP
jgi:ribosomal-protein-alanine N-acetyltransferase